MDEIDKEKIAALPSQLVVATVCHPMEYAKVLIQLGYEPLPPRRSTTLFGRPAMILPNVFQYIKHIKKSDGFFGCYRGLSAKVLGLIASSQLTSTVVHGLGIELPEFNDPPNIITDEEPIMEDYIKLGRRDMIMHTASVVVSYPFHVVSLRMMASFVGKEEDYSSLLGAIVSIYKDDGLLGFYHGIIPKLLGDLTCVAVTGILAYYVNKYLVKTKDLRYYTVPLLTFVTSTITYPLVVVSTCMAVAGSSLKAGNPPLMPAYPSWQSCWRELLRTKQHKRGSSLIFRYYIAPIAAMQ
ncbi:mitochondrial carrier homolog 2-like isoform X2 [Aricia agestis]|uniref:mitochondrial carrier homolog 2-like isoform X1 n=1 Tax=Aricia agestis TaxID=91739 RepID=UPI001C20ABEE|nr:mitochondrial carrier homolog 2-like isoform X1 [Aricia agestis]XP_041986311.1 mitochondrial carrier homolog 2-like isoform X2 [Aricia agestis]